MNPFAYRCKPPSVLVVMVGLVVFTAFKRIQAAESKPAVIEVSSGGVSLGSYQGGYLLGRTIRTSNEDAGKPKILTGASAGAINTLGALYYVFHPYQKTQDYSPYAEWLKIDWTELSSENLQAPVTSLLNVKIIETELGHVVDHILQPPDPGASKEEVQIGFAITRLIQEQVFPDLDVRSAAEKIVIRIRWLSGSECKDDHFEGKGCYQVWTTGFGQDEVTGGHAINHLWFGPYGTDSALIRQNLIALARASSSFPVAFRPQPLKIFNWEKPEICQSDEVLCPETIASKVWENYFFDNCRVVCDAKLIPRDDKEAIEIAAEGRSWVFKLKVDPARGRWPKGPPVKFSDGGQFENQPLELALRIHEYTGGVVKKPTPDEFVGSAPLFSGISAVRMLSPTRYLLKDVPPNVLRSMSAEWLLIYLGNPDATSQELLRALDRGEFTRKKIQLNTTILPLASEHMIHFSGFFEQRFRRFDFLTGFFDAISDTSSIYSGLINQEIVCLESDTALVNPDLAWMWRFLCRKGSQGTMWSLFLEVRNRAVILQDLGNVYQQEPTTDLNSSIKAEVAALKLLQKKNIEMFQAWLKDSKTLPMERDVIYDDMELLQVIHASLERLIGTMETLLDGDTESGAGRYANFQRGLTSFGAWIHHAHERRPPESIDIHLNPKSTVNDVYLQLARFIEQDAMGAGNSFMYPLALYHARAGLGLAAGQKPRWSAPYLRIEGSNPGFRILQGYSLLPRSAPPIPVLDLVRWETGLHSSWNSDPVEFWLPLRVGIELPIGTFLSVTPGMTWSIPLSETKREPRLGVDVLLVDVLNIRADFRDGRRPEISAGARIGFDPWILSEGLVNGTNKDRIRGAR